MNFIRGRSFVNTYLIIDEAQNMTPNQVKGIITRAGKGTKIVLLGDPNQIDRPFLDERTNGLSYASEYMKGSPLCYPIKETFDIHDRVNYAAVASSLQVNVEKKVILLEIELDEEICSILDYFEIFLQRMLMCKRAAEILGLKFKMKANGNKIC